MFTNNFLQNNRSLLREPIELCTSSSRSHRSIIVCWYFLQEHRARSNGQKESPWRWKEISLAPRQRNFLCYNIDNALITILKVTRKNISGERKLENNGQNGMEYWNNGIELHKRGLKGILLYWKIGKWNVWNFSFVRGERQLYDYYRWKRILLVYRYIIFDFIFISSNVWEIFNEIFWYDYACRLSAPESIRFRNRNMVYVYWKNFQIQYFFNKILKKRFCLWFIFVHHFVQYSTIPLTGWY